MGTINYLIYISKGSNIGNNQPYQFQLMNRLQYDCKINM